MNAEFGQAVPVSAGAPWHRESPPDLDTWIERAKAGEVRAFEHLVQSHEAQVYRTALRLLGNREDARDASQEVFLRLFKYLHRFDASRSLSAWLYTMTVNASRDVARKRSKQAAEPLDASHEAKLVVRDGADATADRAEERRIVEAGLKTLAEKERAALVLRDIEGLSTKEVAGILGSSETTVRSQISRARVKLKRYRDAILGNDDDV